MTTTNSTTGSTTSISATELIDSIAAIMRAMPPEPLGEWMRSQGCPPESWVLFIPSDVAPADQALPAYVKVSRAIVSPVFIRRTHLWGRVL